MFFYHSNQPTYPQSYRPLNQASFLLTYQPSIFAPLQPLSQFIYLLTELSTQPTLG